MPSSAGDRVTRALLVLGWAGVLVAVTTVSAGGIDFHIGPLPIRAHSTIPAFVLAIACLAVACRRGAAHASNALAWWWAVFERGSAMLALTAAVVTVVIGALWGTYVAGGSDSYCYLNQAELLAQGQVKQPQPIWPQAPWPNAPATFAPVGHLPATTGEPAIVPACPTGYPLLMAGAKRLGGRRAMFWVVPLLGGWAVWLTFLLGRRLAGNVVGVLAAALLALSPAFLYQVVQPMTDIPALALWTAALVVVIQPLTSGRATLSGLLAGAALLVRPNLLPLVAVTAGAALFVRPFSLRAIGRTLAWFALGVLPFVLAILALNHIMFGGPLQSGYGKLQDLFTIAHVRGNLTRYPVWLIETQTPFVLLALAAPWTRRQDGRAGLAWWLLVFALVTFVCYMPYTVWDAWWFLRFVLPAFPPLLVLSAAVALAGLSRAAPPRRMMAVSFLLGLLGVFQIVTAERRAVFRLRDLEARYRDAGEYVARRLPRNAVVFAVTQSGSVRFYSQRPTIVWSVLDAAWLDRAVQFLATGGYRPYFLLESDEEALFREKFSASSQLGALEWPPIADIDRQVRIYDAADDARYRRGENVVTDYVGARR